MRSITTAIFTMMIASLFGQIEVGFRMGVNINNPQLSGLGSLTENQSAFTGFTGSIFAEIPMTNELAFVPAIAYTQKGFTVDQTTSTNVFGVNVPLGVMAETKVNYVEVPALLKYSYGNEKASVYGLIGPAIGYATDAKVTAKARLIIDFNVASYDVNLRNDNYNRLDLSGLIGVGGQVNAGVGSLFADVRYNHSFTNMLNDPIVDLSIKNSGFNIGAGYKYKF